MNRRIPRSRRATWQSTLFALLITVITFAMGCGVTAPNGTSGDTTTNAGCPGCRCYPNATCDANLVCSAGTCIAGSGCSKDSDCGPQGKCNQNACTALGCGNGFVEANEECDDGNVESGDGCNFRCGVESSVPLLDADPGGTSPGSSNASVNFSECNDETKTQDYAPGAQIAVRVCAIRYINSNNVGTAEAVIQSDFMAAQAYYAAATTNIQLTLLHVDAFQGTGVDTDPNTQIERDALHAATRQRADALHPGECDVVVGYTNTLGAGIGGQGTWPDEGLQECLVAKSNVGAGDSTAHEIGHVFGLFHTFQGPDDGCQDTPHDPDCSHFGGCQTQCAPVALVDNVMSYYHCQTPAADSFSGCQVRRARCFATKMFNPVMCGDGTCSPTENAQNCCQDCGGCQGCGMICTNAGKTCGSYQGCNCGSCDPNTEMCNNNTCTQIACSAICTNAGKNCGSYQGCNCGSCNPNTETCNNNVCIQVACSAICINAGKNCGSYQGCNCGSCNPNTEMCSNNVCSQLPCNTVCANAGKNCGSYQGCNCGSCNPNTEMCSNNVCTVVPQCNGGTCCSDGSHYDAPDTDPGNSCGQCQTCNGFGSCKAKANAAAVNSVSPLTATLDQLALFTVSGSCMPNTVTPFIANCSNPVVTSFNPAQMKFQCTPGFAIGSQAGIIKDMPGGTILYNFNVNVTCTPSVSTVMPLSANLNQLTVFTVNGSCLPNTIVGFIANCVNPVTTSTSLTQAKFQCTPSFSAGVQAGLVKDKPGGVILKNFNLTVN